MTKIREGSLDVIASVSSADDCSIEDGEYSVTLYSVVGFDTAYFDDFNLAVSEWVTENLESLKCERTYQLIMKHVYEHDGAGAITARYFEVIDASYQDW